MSWIQIWLQIVCITSGFSGIFKRKSKKHKNWQIFLNKIAVTRYSNFSLYLVNWRVLNTGVSRKSCVKHFVELLTEKEKCAWLAFRHVGLCSNFLGNVKADNYKELVKNFLKSYQHMGCNMSLKFHILHSHLDFFPPNMGAMWREVSSGYCCHGEKICRKISTENVSRLLLEPQARCFWRQLLIIKIFFLTKGFKK